jgi:Ubiquitin/SUMO-activating enzyme ubiquitin-like domain
MLGGDFIWEEGDGAEDDYQVNLPKKLTDLPCGGIQHGTVLEIDDNSQSLSIQVSVTHQEVWEGDEVPDFPFTVGNMPVKKKEEETPAASESTAVAVAAKTAADDDDDVVLIVDDDEAATNGDKKRPADGGEEKPSKKRRTSEQDVIEIDDD